MEMCPPCLMVPWKHINSVEYQEIHSNTKEAQSSNISVHQLVGNATGLEHKLAINIRFHQRTYRFRMSEQIMNEMWSAPLSKIPFCNAKESG